jgi:hypothetical protein
MGISTQGSARVGGPITARWTDVAGVIPPNPPVVGRPGGGIWQAGGRLVSDKPNEIVLVSGNGDIPPAPTPGTTPSTRLGEAAFRLQVLPTGALQAKDFWTPCNAQDLSDRDADLGSGAPLVLPDSFGTPAVPHVLVVVGKDPPIYLLNRDDFGGFQQGPPGACPDQSGNPGDDIVSQASPPPNSPGVWASPAMWPGDGGLIYLASPSFPQFGLTGNLNAWRVVNNGGQPTLTLAGQSDHNFGYGSSSAIITSNTRRRDPG